MDDSTAATVEFEGGFELGFTAFSEGITATLGQADSFCVLAAGSINVGYFTVGATISGYNNGKLILLTPALKIGEISADYHSSAKVNIGTIEEKCEIISGSYPIWNEQVIPYSQVILYQKQ